MGNCVQLFLFCTFRTFRFLVFLQMVGFGFNYLSEIFFACIMAKKVAIRNICSLIFLSMFYNVFIKV